MPIVTAAAAPAFERLGDAVVRTDDPRAAAARQQLVRDRARARRERVDPIPIPGRGSGPYSKPHSQPATSLRLGDSGLLESQLAAAGPAMARVAPPAMRHSFLQYDAAARRLVHDGRLVTWSPDPDPGPPPPIYQQTADHLLIDLRPGPQHAARADLYPEEDTVSQHRLDQRSGEVTEFPAGPPGEYSATPPDEHPDYVYTDPTMDADAVRIGEPGDVDPDAFPDGWAGQPTERDAAAIVAGNA